MQYAYLFQRDVDDKNIENNGGQAVFDNEDNNHLAKKDGFAEAIVNEQIEIS